MSVLLSVFVRSFGSRARRAGGSKDASHRAWPFASRTGIFLPRSPGCTDTH